MEPVNKKPLPRAFYLRDAESVAKDLVGAYLIHRLPQGELVCQITETEAYLGIGDKGSHSCTGVPTPRTRVQYGIGGHAYLYFIYGMHFMFNVVTGEEGVPGCVLVREARPVEGRDHVALFRFGKPYGELSRAQVKNLLNGPGKFCKGMALAREHNGADLCGRALFLARDGREYPFQVGKRINIDYAGPDADLPLRFTLQG